MLPSVERKYPEGFTMAGDDSDSISLKVSKAIPSDVGHGRARIAERMI